MIELEIVVSRCDGVLLERAKGMQIQFKEGARIENPRDYCPCEVEQLQKLLAEGSPARRDPRRQHFYEVEGQDETYYIFVSPVSGEVVLVAKWKAQSSECCCSAGHLVA